MVPPISSGARRVQATQMAQGFAIFALSPDFGGLVLLARLLKPQGIDSGILEARSCDYVEARVRAGVPEQGTIDPREKAGVADRQHREGLVHGRVQLDVHRGRFPSLLKNPSGHGIGIPLKAMGADIPNSETALRY